MEKKEGRRTKRKREKKELEKNTRIHFANNNFFITSSEKKLNSSDKTLIDYCSENVLTEGDDAPINLPENQFNKYIKDFLKNIFEKNTVYIGKKNQGTSFDKETLTECTTRFFGLLKRYPPLRTKDEQNQQLLLTTMLTKGLNNNQLYEEDIKTLTSNSNGFTNLNNGQLEEIRKFIEDMRYLK